MIFEKDCLSITFLEVLELKQRNVSMNNTGRDFDAISFRFASDACLETKENSYRLSENAVCFVPSGLDYKRSATRDELIAIHFQTENYAGREIEVFKPKAPAHLAALFQAILSVWQAKEVGYQYRCTALLYEILAECHKECARPQASHSPIEVSVRYLLEHFKDPDLSVGTLAERSFMSEVYFRKLFKSELGTSPQKYIIDLRIRNAVALMSTGYYSLKEIAHMSGYRDYKYFSTEFKRIKGLSPSEYLRDHV